jgi:triphosphatase
MSNEKKATGGSAAGEEANGEIELKLRGAPEALKALLDGTAISARATGRGSSKRLEAVYYDTADRRLRARGLAFRVRKDGRRYQQTLKSNDAGGLVAYRGEWQTPLASAEPDLALLPLEASEVLNGLVEGDELRSQFTTRVRRETRRLETGANGTAGVVEAALDLGEIGRISGRGSRGRSASAACS